MTFRIISRPYLRPSDPGIAAINSSFITALCASVDSLLSSVKIMLDFSFISLSLKSSKGLLLFYNILHEVDDLC